MAALTAAGNLTFNKIPRRFTLIDLSKLSKTMQSLILNLKRKDMKTQITFAVIASLCLTACPPWIKPGNQKPDLVITNFSVSPPSPEPQKNVKANLTVQNLGKKSAARFSVRWRPFESHPGFSQDISELSSEESKTVAFEFAYSNTGAFASEATVDAQNAVDESNEANNTSSLTINVVPPVKADLWIRDITFDPPEAEVNQTMRASVVVENAGPGPAGSFVVMWRPYPGHAGLTKPVSGLHAQQSSSLAFEFIYNNSGPFQTEAIADVNLQVSETDEANSKILGIVIRPRAPESMAYEIRVKTGSIEDAGTDAKVYVILWGKNGKSDEFQLDNAENNFERNNTDIFAFRTKYLGEFEKLRIRHDSSKKKPGWFLDYIEISEKEGSNRCWRFDCFRWLAKDEDDGQIERELNALQCGAKTN
ncbi:hypothetical protein DCC62_27125 [candidate division KSB1 bacterium]|nr:MAG: hypothetical protein DCC62_27125 [candidate division KSB1 bacterium]